MRPEAGRPTYPIASVDNALKLLLLFGHRPTVRLSEASAYLDVAHSTAHRLLAMLAYHGFVRQDPTTKAYAPGRALVEVGLAVVHRMDIRTTARPVMQNLKDKTGETVHLAVLEGVDVRYLDCVESDKALRVTSRTGTLLPAHCTSVGKALLAACTPQEFDALFPDGSTLAAISSGSIRVLSVLKQHLEEVRKRGYATNRGESEEGVASVAVAVRNHGNRPVAGLSVAAPFVRMNNRRTKEVAKMLLEGAEALSSALPG
jgi:IclR family transcriptional regulator, acetate operon repressor